MHLAHLEARLLKGRDENLVTRCSMVVVKQVGYIQRQGWGRSCLCVIHFPGWANQLLPKYMPRRRSDIVNRISIKSSKFLKTIVFKKKTVFK